MVFGQKLSTPDSVNVSDELINIKLNLKKFRNQHRAGLWTQVAGLAMIGGGSLLDTSPNDQQAASALYVFGGLGMFTGFCLRMNSFRFLDRAALSISPTGGRFVYRFK